VKRGGGIYDRVKEGASIGVAPWRGRGAARRPWHGGVRGGDGGAAGSVREGRRRRGVRLDGPAQPAWPLGAKRLDGPAGHSAES
jgi:hypothetical protein